MNSEELKNNSFQNHINLKVYIVLPTVFGDKVGYIVYLPIRVLPT